MSAAGPSPLPLSLLQAAQASVAGLGPLVERVAPVLVFFVAITLVAEIADAAGVAMPAGASIAATVAVLALLHRRELRGRYFPEAPAAPHDRTLLLVAAAVCTALGPAFAAGLSPAVVSSAAAAVLLVTTAARSRRLLRGLAVPWRMALGLVVLFVAVDLLQQHGLGRLLAHAVGAGSSAAALGRMAGVAALAANAVNNLPAYLALEPTAGHSGRLVALLIGTNVGPLVTPWASLATLLWMQRCRSAGVSIAHRSLALQGLTCALAAGLAAVAALALVS